MVLDCDQRCMNTNTIIFDGECNLCNGVVGWLLNHAPHSLFEFVPFQSSFGQDLLLQHGFPTTDLETVILIDGTKIYTHSDGFLKIISKIQGWEFLAFGFGLVPKFVRDTMYKVASKNRVRWFGKSNTCAISL